MFRASLILLVVAGTVALNRPPESLPVKSNAIELQESRWESARIRPEKVHFVEGIVAEIRRSQTRYDNVALRTHIPWPVIASIHNMECGLSFRQNLANGDSISYKTRHVPASRPPGTPPFTWEYCAVDALRFDHLDRKYWNEIGWELQNIENYNGPGYQKYHPDVPTPYLWSFTTVYLRGKYIQDGQWSSTAISQQCGVVPLLKSLP